MKMFIRSSQESRLDGFTLMPKQIDGYKIYKKLVNDRGVWRAMLAEFDDSQFKEKSFSISYDQARGFEPIDDSQLQSHQLGMKLNDKLYSR